MIDAMIKKIRTQTSISVGTYSKEHISDGTETTRDTRTKPFSDGIQLRIVETTATVLQTCTGIFFCGGGVGVGT